VTAPADWSWPELLARIDDEIARRADSPGQGTGGDAAWEEIQRRIRRYADRLFPWAPVADREDLVAGALLGLQSPGRVRRMQAVEHPAAYLVQTLRHAMTDLLRRRQREREALSHVGLLATLQQQRPVQTAAAKADALRHAFSLLDADQRELLRLRFWEDLPIADIASRLGLPYSTVAKRLFRVLQALRQRFRPS